MSWTYRKKLPASARVGLWIAGFSILTMLYSSVYADEQIVINKNWLEAQIIIFANTGLSSKESCPSYIQSIKLPDNAKMLQTPAELSSRQLLESVAKKDSTVQMPTEEESEHTSPATDMLKQNVMVWLPPTGDFESMLSKIKSSPDYALLYAARWRMSSDALNKGVNLTIPSFLNKDASENLDQHSDHLSGFISFYKKKSFYIRTNLVHHPASAGENLMVNESAKEDEKRVTDCEFPVKRIQHFTLNTLTYVDNPAVGILFEINKPIP